MPYLEECGKHKYQNKILQKHDKEEQFPEYQKLLGRLLWLLYTRPDISHAIKEVSRHCQRNVHIHFMAIKRILRYLSGTRNEKLSFRGADTLSAVPFYERVLVVINMMILFLLTLESSRRL